MILQTRLAEARAQLVTAGFDPRDAAADVDVLARAVLGWDRVRLLTDQNLEAPGTLEPTFSQWIERRSRREPSAYITGVREFWGLEFRVTPAVLIPRPETELIVEEALAQIGSFTAPRIADIGTGSGVLAVSLAHELPEARIVASDLSADALAVARQNATRLGVADRIEFVATSYLDGVDGPFDFIVANPPYVREKDARGLSPDVRHEPDVALFGGADGLRDIAGVFDTVTRVLTPGGWLIMEFGLGQEEWVRELLATRQTLRIERVRDDLQGIARTAIIQRQ